MREVSVIVPVKDEAHTIRALLDSISLQTVLPEEVIIVDGGSKDETREIIKDYADKGRFKIKLIETGRAYPGEARNRGIEESSFDLVAFTDAGIRLDRRWLEELLGPMEEDVDVVYGAYEPVADSFIKECGLMAYVPPREEIGGKALRTDFIASSLFKKSACRKAGAFPPFRAAEDRIFMERVKGSGAKIRYTDKAVAYWAIPGTIGGIFSRFCEFSMHDIMAGKAKDWHYSVFRTYGLFAAFAILGFSVNPVFLWGIAMLWLARMGLILYKRRLDFRPKFVFDVRYLSAISLIVFVTDMALFSGSVRYMLRRLGKYA